MSGRPNVSAKETAVKAGRLEHPRHVLVALRLEDIVDIGLGVAPRARELRGRAGLDIGQEVHLAVAHRPLLLKDGLLKDRRSSPNSRRDLRCKGYQMWRAGRSIRSDHSYSAKLVWRS